jgi:hypothetical protein
VIKIHSLYSEVKYTIELKLKGHNYFWWGAEAVCRLRDAFMIDSQRNTCRPSVDVEFQYSVGEVKEKSVLGSKTWQCKLWLKTLTARPRSILLQWRNSFLICNMYNIMLNILPVFQRQKAKHKEITLVSLCFTCCWLISNHCSRHSSNSLFS